MVTYFDESALTSHDIEGNGVAIFGMDGRFRFGYRELFGERAVDIADCYCACRGENNRIFFFPYTNFPLVSFNIDSKTQEVWETPAEVGGSNGLSMLGSTVYFHSPYSDKQGIYKWQIGDRMATLIGTHEGRLRGLPRGRFLSIDNSGYTILSAAEI